MPERGWGGETRKGLSRERPNFPYGRSLDDLYTKNRVMAYVTRGSWHEDESGCESKHTAAPPKRRESRLPTTTPKPSATRVPLVVPLVFALPFPLQEKLRLCQGGSDTARHTTLFTAGFGSHVAFALDAAFDAVDIVARTDPGMTCSPPS